MASLTIEGGEIESVEAGDGRTRYILTEAGIRKALALGASLDRVREDLELIADYEENLRTGRDPLHLARPPRNRSPQ